MLQKKYIATFFSHFGAIRFKRELYQKGLDAKVMPVPRQLSSSCGTCVSYSSDDNSQCELSRSPEMEMIVEVTCSGYKEVFRAADS